MCGGYKITDWKKNSDGVRNLEQAISLLARNGITVPEDVRVAIYDELDPDVLASYLLPHESPADARYSWENLLNDFGQVPIKVRSTVFESDEQIIAVLGHELYELGLLRRHLEENETISAGQMSSLIATNTTSKNFHCLASQYGDRAVLKFRGQNRDSYESTGSTC